MIDLVPWEVMTKISEVKLGALNYHNELIFFFFLVDTTQNLWLAICYSFF